MPFQKLTNSRFKVLERKDFDFSSDVFSFGVVLWEIFTGLEPWAELSELSELMDAVCVRAERPPINDDGSIPPEVAALIRNCWAQSPSDRPQFPEIVKRLEDIIVSSAITESEACAFWKAHWTAPLQSKVLWRTFAVTLSGAISVPLNLVNQVADLFLGYDPKTAGEVQHMTMGRFNLLSTWFGNFFKGAVGQSEFAHIIKLTRTPWFHGDISMSEATSRLMMRPEGTFLVRLSYRDASAPFTLSSAVNQGQAEHRRIYRILNEHTSKPEFAIQLSSSGFARFATLEDLVEGLQQARAVTGACPKAKAIQVGYN